MYALCMQVLVMRIFKPSPGRKELTAREKIVILLGQGDLLNFEDDEHCRGAAGNRELPIDLLGRARNRLIPNSYEVWVAYEHAADWCTRGKNDHDKAVRGFLIAPRYILLRDEEVAKLCGVTRQRINFLRLELSEVLILAKDERYL
jgi:hypothetical protein